jgi:acyl-CoA synthetase (AMP-forming)/AMP-acid ligase II
MMINSIRFLLEESAKNTPDKVAFIEKSNTITYLELLTKVNKIASYLNSLNLDNGSRVGVYSNKCIEQIISILAILSTNLTMVPISDSLKIKQVNHIITDCGISCILTDQFNFKKLKLTGYKNIIITFDGQCGDSVSFNKIYNLLNELTLALEPSISSNCNAVIIYSSGSTGLPKGIVSSHKNLSDGARIVSNYLGLQGSDVISGVLSFNFDYGLNQIYCTLFTNATLVLHSYFLPNNFFTHLISDEITVLPLMPVFFSRMFDKKTTKSVSISSLSNIRLICSSGGRITSEMLENIDIFFPYCFFYSMYGLTEAFRSTYLNPDQLKIRPTSIGKAIPDVELYIIDEQGNECSSNEVGELIHRGGCIGKGYWNRIEETKNRYKSINLLNKVINMEGNLASELVVCSGDYAYKDEEGYIYFVSRKDEMIKSSGYRISPYEVESSVYQYINDIKECAVFSVEDDKVGQKIVMAYTSNKLIVENNIKFKLKMHLPNYMVPSVIYKVDSMPVTTANQGKINKSNIKQDYLNGNNKGKF